MVIYDEGYFQKLKSIVSELNEGIQKEYHLVDTMFARRMHDCKQESIRHSLEEFYNQLVTFRNEVIQLNENWVKVEETHKTFSLCRETCVQQKKHITDNNMTPTNSKEINCQESVNCDMRTNNKHNKTPELHKNRRLIETNCEKKGKGIDIKNKHELRSGRKETNDHSVVKVVSTCKKEKTLRNSNTWNAEEKIEEWNFSKPGFPNIQNNIPCYLLLDGQKRLVSSWSEMIVELAIFCMVDHNYDETFGEGLNCIKQSSSRANLRKPELITSGIYLEMDFPDKYFMEYAKNMIYCTSMVTLNQITVGYKHKPVKHDFPVIQGPITEAELGKISRDDKNVNMYDICRRIGVTQGMKCYQFSEDPVPDFTYYEPHYLDIDKQQVTVKYWKDVLRIVIKVCTNRIHFDYQRAREIPRCKIDYTPHGAHCDLKIGKLYLDARLTANQIVAICRELISCSDLLRHSFLVYYEVVKDYGERTPVTTPIYPL